MYLPPGVEIIRTFERDNFDSYQVGPGRSFCFQFSLAEGDPLDIRMTHVNNMNQDWSLRCWFSKKAFSLPFFFPDDDVDVFSMARYPRTIRVGSSEHNKLDPNTIYYFNVQNLQNSNNQFFLQFGLDNIDPCDTF